MLVSPLTDAALRARRTSPAEVLARVGELFRSRVRLELDLALLLSWIQRADVATLGYSSFSAFCSERVDWRTSWLRDLLRLVESPLDLVKRAVADDAIPLSFAIRAPGHVDVSDQAAWLLDQTLPVGEPPRSLTEVTGDDAVAVRKARRLARICLGGARTASEVDDYVVACWRDRVPAEQILAHAHERPERPVLAPVSWEWRGEPAPASLAEAMARLEALQATLRGLTPAVARAWALLVDGGVWRVRYASVRACAFGVLGLSLRQSQRLAKLGRTLMMYPEIDRAVREGLSVGAAEQLGWHGPSNDTLALWIALARSVGAKQLARAVAEARWDDRPTLASHEALAGIASATSTGALASSGAPATSTGARVAPIRDELPVTRAPLRCPPELVQAARWWVETVRLPVLRGFAKVKERDGYRCQNPECGRISIRNEAHHLVFLSEGGSDCPDTNGVTLCRACHLRLVHAGRLTVERLEVGAHVVLRWTWADGRTVVGWAPTARASARGLRAGSAAGSFSEGRARPQGTTKNLRSRS